MSNSPFVDYTQISPNKTTGRKYAISRITPHCVVGQATIERLGEIFAPESKQASSNYGIGVDGRVGMYVEEKDRSWCSSSSDNDNRAVTIECASDTAHPYAFKDVVYERLIDLCADICKRNGKDKLLWISDKDEALAYKPASNEMLITVHRWFKNKECPGEWLFSRLGDLAAKVNAKLGSATEEAPKEEAKKEYKYYVQVGGAYTEFLNASNVLGRLKNAGFDAKIVFGETINVTEVTEKEEPKVETSSLTLKEGDLVRMQKGAPVYCKNYPFKDWVYSTVLFVRDIAGDRIVVSTMATGSITGAVHKQYLTKV